MKQRQGADETKRTYDNFIPLMIQIYIPHYLDPRDPSKGWEMRYKVNNSVITMYQIYSARNLFDVKAS